MSKFGSLASADGLSRILGEGEPCKLTCGSRVKLPDVVGNVPSRRSDLNGPDTTQKSGTFGHIASDHSIRSISKAFCRGPRTSYCRSRHRENGCETSQPSSGGSSNVPLATTAPPSNKHDTMVMAEFERRRKARTLTLPTDDVQVKLKLRKLNQPICLFGEDILDRRERLRAILSTLSEDEVAAILHSDDTQDKGDEETTTWYHRGPVALRTARVMIADFSLRRAKERLEKARSEIALASNEKALARQETQKWVQQLNLHASQVADTRPIGQAEFSPDSEHIVTAGWSGQASVWNRATCQNEIRFNGHQAQCGAARFHPGAFVSNDAASMNVATGGHDGSLFLWSLEKETPLAELENHGARVSSIAFHPNGRHMATTCYDASWRMFDLDTGDEILFQEGHAKAVSDVSFHPDGSVALTTGLDCYGRVWDLRTGRCIMFLDGHTKEIYTGDWLPNGYEMITGGADNAIKVWDLRMRKNTYTVPAHSSVVSKVKVDKTGLYVISSGFDCTLKLWSTTGWQPLRQLAGHDTKIMCVDISPDGKWIMSSAFDRTFKLWAPSDY